MLCGSEPTGVLGMLLLAVMWAVSCWQSLIKAALQADH